MAQGKKTNKSPVPAPKKTPAAKKAVPKVKAARRPARTMSKPIRGAKPKSTGDKSKPGPLGQKNGSGSIPYQGPGPMGQGVY